MDRTNHNDEHHAGSHEHAEAHDVAPAAASTDNAAPSTPPVIMGKDDQARFWRLYDKQVRTPVERACRRLSRTLTDNAMDPDDMVAWVDQRVWKMLETGAWPTFHDNPSPEAAIERLVNNAATLARWAHLALVRKTFRRAAREAAYEKTVQAEVIARSEPSRTEVLAATSGAGASFEKTEAISADLARVKAAVAERLRQKMAAAWSEPSERQRIAMALGVTDESTDELIESTTTGDMKVNTVQQMRSRATREIRSIMAGAAKAVGMLTVAAFLALGVNPPGAYAGEQTGGRGGSGRGGRTIEQAVASVEQPPAAKEQTGGRGPG
jgi:hypothetical protein